MKSLFFLFTGALALSCGLMAITIDISVPLPPDAWTATGPDAGGITETGDDSMAKVEWGPMSDESSLTFVTPVGPSGGSPGALTFTNDLGSLDTANLRVLYEISGIESAIIELELHFSIAPAGFLGAKEITFTGQTDITPQPVAVDGLLFEVSVLGFLNGPGVVVDSFIVDGGETGTRTLGGVVIAFPIVPEPSTYLILGSLLGVGALARRKKLEKIT